MGNNQSEIEIHNYTDRDIEITAWQIALPNKFVQRTVKVRAYTSEAVKPELGAYLIQARRIGFDKRSEAATYIVQPSQMGLVDVDTSKSRRQSIAAAATVPHDLILCVKLIDFQGPLTIESSNDSAFLMEEVMGTVAQLAVGVAASVGTLLRSRLGPPGGGTVVGLQQQSPFRQSRLTDTCPPAKNAIVLVRFAQLISAFLAPLDETELEKYAARFLGHSVSLNGRRNATAIATSQLVQDLDHFPSTVLSLELGRSGESSIKARNKRHEECPSEVFVTSACFFTKEILQQLKLPIALHEIVLSALELHDSESDNEDKDELFENTARKLLISFERVHRYLSKRVDIGGAKLTEKAYVELLPTLTVYESSEVFSDLVSLLKKHIELYPMVTVLASLHLLLLQENALFASSQPLCSQPNGNDDLLNSLHGGSPKASRLSPSTGAAAFTPPLPSSSDAESRFQYTRTSSERKSIDVLSSAPRSKGDVQVYAQKYVNAVTNAWTRLRPRLAPEGIRWSSEFFTKRSGRSNEQLMLREIVSDYQGVIIVLENPFRTHDQKMKATRGGQQSEAAQKFLTAMRAERMRVCRLLDPTTDGGLTTLWTALAQQPLHSISDHHY